MYIKIFFVIFLLLICLFTCYSIYQDVTDTNHDSFNNHRLSDDIRVNSYERYIATKCIQQDIDQQKIPPLIGHDSVIQEIESISRMWSLETDDPLYAPPSGLLLYGPPGTGKTTLAKHISKTLFGANVSFLNVSADTFENKYQGEGLKYLRSVFTLGLKLSPCVLFFDEIDGFMSKRSDADQTHVNGMKTTFLTGMDQIISGRNARVLVICATNRPKCLDPALMRRMEIHFHTDFPTYEQRTEAFMKWDVLTLDIVEPFVKQHLPESTTIHDINTFIRFCVRKQLRNNYEMSLDKLLDMYSEYKSVFKIVFTKHKK